MNDREYSDAIDDGYITLINTYYTVYIGYRVMFTIKTSMKNVNSKYKHITLNTTKAITNKYLKN